MRYLRALRRRPAPARHPRRHPRPARPDHRQPARRLARPGRRGPVRHRPDRRPRRRRLPRLGPVRRSPSSSRRSPPSPGSGVPSPDPARVRRTATPRPRPDHRHVPAHPRHRPPGRRPSSPQRPSPRHRPTLPRPRHRPPPAPSTPTPRPDDHRPTSGPGGGRSASDLHDPVRRAGHLLGPRRALPRRRPTLARDLAPQRRTPPGRRGRHDLTRTAPARLDRPPAHANPRPSHRPNRHGRPRSPSPAATACGPSPRTTSTTAAPGRHLFRLNKGKPQPDGGRLTDPDLIHPGWILTLPDATELRGPDTW